MKQKVVLRVQMADAKKRAKAMKLAAGLTGVVSTAIEGAPDKNQIVVVGEGVDPVTLTTLLRKHMGVAELISVSAVEDKKEAKKEEKMPAESAQVVVWPPDYGGGYTQPFYVAEDVRGHYQDPSCTIM